VAIQKEEPNLETGNP